MADLNARIKPKKSSTTGEVPQAADLEVAEIAVNTADGKLFFKHTDDSIKEISGAGVGATNLNELTDVTTYEGPSGYDELGKWSTNVETGFPDANSEWRIYSVDSPDTLQFYKNNHDGVDRSTELLTLTSGSQFEWSFDNVNWTVVTTVSDTVFSGGGGGNTVLNITISDADGQPIEDGAVVGTKDLWIRIPSADFISPSDGQVLTWINANGRWEPADAASGATAIDELTDVDTSTTPPTDGQALTWVDTNSRWEPADAAGGVPYSVRYSSGAPTWIANTIATDFSGLAEGEMAITTPFYVNLVLTNIDANGVDRSSQLANIVQNEVLTFTWNGGANTLNKTVTDLITVENGGYSIRVNNSSEPWNNGDLIEITSTSLTSDPVAIPVVTGDVLTWNSVTQVYEPTPLPSEGIDDLTDVDTSTTPPTDGQVLTWDNANSQWEPADLQGAAVRTALGIGEYVDDAAAGTGGVASGAMYYNTTSSDYRLKT